MLLNPTNAFWKDLMLDELTRLSAIQTSTDPQGLLDINTYRNKAMRIFIQFLNPYLHFTNKLTIPTHIEEALEQPVILNPHTNLNFSSNNAYFYSIPTKNITDKFNIIRDLCQFLQPRLVSYTRFEEKLVHSSQSLEAQNEKRNFSKIALQDSVLTEALLGK